MTLCHLIVSLDYLSIQSAPAHLLSIQEIIGYSQINPSLLSISVTTHLRDVYCCCVNTCQY